MAKDVNLKMIDNVMAGVESVMGRLSRYSMMEKFRNFDKKYIKRVLLNKDADDYLSLRLQEITIDEHYARLYMPAMIMHEKLQVVQYISD